MARWRHALIVGAVVALALAGASAATQATSAQSGPQGGAAAVTPATVLQPAALLKAVPRIDPGAVLRAGKAHGLDTAGSVPALAVLACALLLWSIAGLGRATPALAVVRTTPSRGPPSPFTR